MGGPSDDPVPGRDPASGRGRLIFTLEVDGEVFAVRSRDGGTDYDWVSGRNPDYGFGTTASPSRSQEEHVESIRAFLGMIDPETGYIADD